MTLKLGVLSDLPSAIADAAYVAGEEAAWDRSHALLVVDYCADRDLAVSGIEIWLATSPGPTIPTPYIYGWEASRRVPGETWATFVARSNLEARHFIATFEWDSADTTHFGSVPYFNLQIVSAVVD